MATINYYNLLPGEFKKKLEDISTDKPEDVQEVKNLKNIDVESLCNMRRCKPRGRFGIVIG